MPEYIVFTDFKSPAKIKRFRSGKFVEKPGVFKINAKSKERAIEKFDKIIMEIKRKENEANGSTVAKSTSIETKQVDKND